MDITMRKYCWRGFIWKVTPQDFVQRFKSYNYVLNIVVPRRESSAESKGFHLNGNTIGFCPQTQSSKRHS